jgi:hypothetical protein
MKKSFFVENKANKKDILSANSNITSRLKENKIVTNSKFERKFYFIYKRHYYLNKLNQVNF